MELDGPTSLEAHRSHTCVSQLPHRSMRQTHRRVNSPLTPPGASDEEAAEGASRVGQIGGGIAHLGEITQRMGQLDEALSSLRQNLFPTQAVPTGQTA